LVGGFSVLSSSNRINFVLLPRPLWPSWKPAGAAQRFQRGRGFTVHWGQLTQLADSAEEFKRLMVQPENANEWFVPQLVGDILASGKRLEAGECFGYKVPPVLGGELEPDNFEPTDLQVHFGILGQIHRQVKDLPPGTPIGEIKIE
jgi:hypothetical protein